ncbi:MAG TPA: hypothetical protein VI670_06030 [Thermoanaerobaculia bacterium]
MSLGSALAPALAGHPSACGVVSLRDARDAFAARVRSAEGKRRITSPKRSTS